MFMSKYYSVTSDTRQSYFWKCVYYVCARELGSYIGAAAFCQARSTLFKIDDKILGILHAMDIYVNSRQDDGTAFVHEFSSWTEIRYKYT